MSALRTVAAAGLVGLLAVACTTKEGPTVQGNPSASPTSVASPPVALQGAVTNHGSTDVTSMGSVVSLKIEQDDFYFDPTFVKASPGARVVAELENEGAVPHTFTIDSLGVDKEVPAGHEADVTFTLPSSGVVRFHCRFHAGQGMQGAFYFVAGSSAGIGGGGAGGYGYGG